VKKDIGNREDIILLVDSFYQKVQLDHAIGHIFNEIIKIAWSHHLPKMYDFWESLLFGKATYKGNPMLTHFDINHKIALRTVEFDAWKNLFFTTVDDLFAGENAETIKRKAQSIADLMQFKLNEPKSRFNIV